ncbi:tetratricopeptide repeat protein [Streptomyces misionensis]|uniref:tetratricopeptide repeat protein n=1 Tax=Streptomyces misionensis TaxID=67331 RepID=UPI0036967E42
MTDGPGSGAGGPRATGERSLSVGGSVSVAITGDGAEVVMLPAETVRWAKEVEAPPGEGNLPGPASGVFVGRAAELAELRRLLTGAGEAAVTRVAGTRVIHGLGGIGKTTLALHYAHTFRRTYTLVWWINATSTKQIVAGLAGIATRLCPHWATTTGVQERAAWAIRWLQWHPGWLLVFDNVENPADLRHYLGMLPDGHHLATSRTATGWHAVAPTMPLGLLDPDAATGLLCTLALGAECAPTPRQRRDAAALAAELGYLPLALEQAGAYLFETGTPLGEYRAMLGQVIDTTVGGIDPERTIAAVWRHTLTVIERRNPQAITLLDAMAWLAPDVIPRTLLAPLCPDARTLGEALGALHAYNMIAYSVDRRSVSVHRLVQTVLRSRPPGKESGGYPPGRQDAERLLQRAADDDTGSPPWERLLPHAIAITESTPPGTPASIETANVLQALAEYQDREGRNAHTVGLRTAALAHYEQLLGDSHPQTLTSRQGLAGAYQDAGDPDRAIPLYEAALALCEETLGDAHPRTLAGRNDLANAYTDAGNPARAVPLLEATLARSEKLLGDIHAHTLIHRNNLANAYKAAGDLARAIPLYETTLRQSEETLGVTHPDTLISRNNLAGAYKAAGDLTRAIPLYKATLGQRERVLGETHPHTLNSRHNLANAYRAAGDLARAVPLYETTLAQRERVLGETHPHTLISRDNLADALRAARAARRPDSTNR